MQGGFVGHDNVPPMMNSRGYDRGTVTAGPVSLLLRGGVHTEVFGVMRLKQLSGAGEVVHTRVSIGKGRARVHRPGVSPFPQVDAFFFKFPEKCDFYSRSFVLCPSGTPSANPAGTLTRCLDGEAEAPATPRHGEGRREGRRGGAHGRAPASGILHARGRGRPQQE